MKKTLAFALIAQALSIAIIITLSLQFFKQLKSYNEYSNQVEHTYLIINELAQTEILLKDAETSSRGYIITRNKSFLEPLDKAKLDVFLSLDSLRSLISDNPEQKAIYKKLEKTVYSKMLLQVENAHNVSKYSHDSLLNRMLYGQLLMRDFMENISDMKAIELSLLTTRKDKKDKFERQLPEQVRIVFFIAGLSTLIFGFWIFIELRKRFKYQEQLQQKVRELRQNNEELEQVAFAASHDLQEPLRKIRIFSDRLMVKLKALDVDEDIISMAQRMNYSATRMQDLINDLIRFNKLVQPGSSDHPQPLELKNIIDQAQQWMENNSTVPAHVTIKGELPIVKGIPAQIETLFQELFSNAYQFKMENRLLEITISANKIDGAALPQDFTYLANQQFHHISFADNGSGFEEIYKSKMFKPFQRLHNYAENNEVRNKGMGLAICKRIMLNHNGWIDAEGKPGVGATIHLYFLA